MSIGTISTDDFQTGEPLPIEVDFGDAGKRVFLYKVLDFDDNELERSNDINELKSTFQKKYPYFKPKDIDPFIYEI